ncbi:hypothetical protein SELMODRAFT_437614 [Selaginella moellendorffii]|uniref:Uncharacterized protein n=1 Tax=Selaginella moellendorffii TaxID=88036 RepID=D8QNE3_SELML|nr:uncharacterized protein LOC9632566 [Selaginella moellendorffii]EFJ38746.1 hypothetical protein SELMODRAFT_437614 [Selaginella moellendorffii]|eukprot:XP_002961207.1 uncharacterized protein LOC9632566 [Selaginella moellendorffii]
MAVVWVKRGDEALRFPLIGSKLMVSSIARHWGLDPDSLRIGNCALVPGADGNSVLSLDAIAALLQDQPDLGDGSSHEQALVITGRRRSADHPAVQDHIRQRDEENLVAKKQRAEVARSRQLEAYRSNVEGLWSYVKELELTVTKPEQVCNVMQSRVSKMVARLHFVEGDDEPSDDNYKGLAALVKPDGSCFTAAVCCNRSSTSGKYVLVFSDPPLEYECVVTYEEEVEIAILTPAKPVSFNYCINWNDSICKSDHAYSWKRDPQSGDVKCVAGIFIEDPSLPIYQFEPYHMVMLPVESTVEVGAPVLDDAGHLGGVVVEFEEIPARDTRPTKKKKKNGERRLDETAIRDQFQNRVKEDPDFGKALEAGFVHRKAVVYVACLDIDGLTTVWYDWTKAHPLKEFEPSSSNEQNVIHWRRHA